MNKQDIDKQAEREGNALRKQKRHYVGYYDKKYGIRRYREATYSEDKFNKLFKD
jgi:hypothetical protein